MENILKNKWTWIIVGVIVLIYFGNKQGWFKAKANTTPTVPPDQAGNTGGAGGTSTERGLKLNSNSALINAILAKARTLGAPQSKINELTTVLNNSNTAKLTTYYSRVNTISNPNPKNPSTLKTPCFWESGTKDCPGCSVWDKTFELHGCAWGLN